MWNTDPRSRWPVADDEMRRLIRRCGDVRAGYSWAHDRALGLFQDGEFDQALDMISLYDDEATPEEIRRQWEAWRLWVGFFRGHGAPDKVLRAFSWLEDRCTDRSRRAFVDLAVGEVLLILGRFGEALARAEASLDNGIWNRDWALALMSRATVWAGDRSGIEGVLDCLDRYGQPGELTDGHRLLLHGAAASMDGDVVAAAGQLSRAVGVMDERALGMSLVTVRAAIAHLLGTEHPLGREAAEAAEKWIADTGADRLRALLPVWQSVRPR
jgi:hypothetical protein